MRGTEKLLQSSAARKLLNRETLSYLICGALTTVISFGVYALCGYIGLVTVIANTISTVSAVVFAFIVNKIFVFRSASWNMGILLPEIAKFCVARVATYVMETLLLVFLVDILQFHSLLMKGLTTVLVVVGNFVLSKWMVFNRKQ